MKCRYNWQIPDRVTLGKIEKKTLRERRKGGLNGVILSYQHTNVFTHDFDFV